MEDGCSSVTKQKIDGYLPSSSGISPNSTIIVDRNRLGWMTTVWELNIPEDNDEMQQVKKLQQKSETHRINANRTYWLYFWSGGYDIYLLQKIHEVKLENYVQKQKIFQEKFCKKDEQKMERNGEENGGKNEKNQQNMEKCVNNYCSMDEVEEEEKNQNAMKNETDYPSKVHNTQQQWMEEKTAMEEEMKAAMEELKCLEQRIELQRDCFNGRIKFLRTIWDEEFFSPFETIDTSAQKLTHRNEDTYIIRLSSTAVGNITLTKRSMVEGKEKVTHRRLPIVGSSIFDYEYLTVIRNNQANNYVVDDMKVRGYYPAHLLSYVYVQK